MLACMKNAPIAYLPRIRRYYQARGYGVRRATSTTAASAP